MIIAIDGYEANVPSRLGIGRYAYEIIRHIYREVSLRNAKEKNCNLQFRIYLPCDPLPDMPKETEWWQYRVSRSARLWTFISLPLRLVLDMPQADVVFSPTHYIPRFTNIARAMTVMDLSYLSFPQLFRPKDLHQLIHWTKYSAEHARAIFTISEFTKRAILDTYNVSENRVVVTYPGLTSMSDQQQSLAKMQSKYKIGKLYILAVGTIQPRKNFVRLIEAFSLVKEKLKQKFGQIELVIVGKKGWLYEEILAAPSKYGVSARVKFLDFVPDEDLPDLYAHALCFALPSLYEGFGLPVLEAMARGCPVVVSNTSSLPEIAAKAGVYVDPTDVASIAKGLVNAIQQRNLMQGRLRAKAASGQVAKFTWEQAAKQTLQVLENIAKN